MAALVALVVATSSAWAQDDAGGPSRAGALETRGLVLVHVDSSEPVILQDRSDAKHDWISLCWSPCDQRVPGDREYRIASRSIRASKPFTLKVTSGADPGRVTLKVDPQHKTGAEAGTVIAALGAGAVLTGFLYALSYDLGQLLCTDNPQPGSFFDKPCDHTGDHVGEAIALTGLAAIIGGLILWGVNAHGSNVSGDALSILIPQPPPTWASSMSGTLLRF